MRKEFEAPSWTDYANEAQLRHYDRLCTNLAALEETGDSMLIRRAVQIGIQMSDLAHLVKIPRNGSGKKR